MRSLTEHISTAFGNAELMVESIGSDKIRKAFTMRNGKLSGYFNVYRGGIANELQWDKLTDADVQEMSTEEARKLAYKKDSEVYVIWLDPQGEFVARTIGNWATFMDRNFENNVRNTVKSISMASDKALVIADYDKFGTRELKAKRNEARRGALALMSDAEVAKANLKRYRDILNEKRLNELNLGDVIDQVKEVLNDYAKMVGDLTTNVIVTNDYKTVAYALTDIENDVQKIMSYFKNILRDQGSYERYKSHETIAADYRKSIVTGVEKLRQLISEFRKKYVPDEE